MDVTTQYADKINEALTVTEAKEESLENNEITLSTGVRLRLKKINILRINAVVDQFHYPEVPEVWDEHREKSFKNPDSPTYQQMKAEVDEQRTLAVIDAIAALGTEIAFVPPAIPVLESDDWLEELAFLKIPVVTDSRLARYLAWIKFVAIGDVVDLQKITEQFGVTMGTAEGKVAESIQRNFPDQAVRETN
jgi:hypothetical protein